jgi:uncharacterized membrane protein YjgN (DUF898 family)
VVGASFRACRVVPFPGPLLVASPWAYRGDLFHKERRELPLNMTIMIRIIRMIMITTMVLIMTMMMVMMIMIIMTIPWAYRGDLFRKERRELPLRKMIMLMMIIIMMMVIMILMT